MQTNGDMQIRGVGIHAVGPVVICLAQWPHTDSYQSVNNIVWDASDILMQCLYCHRHI